MKLFAKKVKIKKFKKVVVSQTVLTINNTRNLGKILLLALDIKANDSLVQSYREQ